MTEEQNNYTAGHRKRLRQKVLNADVAENLPDYEVLEFLLCLAIPRKDVKWLAKDLLNKFGNLAGVINAKPEELTSLPGIKETTAAALKIVGIAAVRMLKVQTSSGPVISSWEKLIDYVRASLIYNNQECFRVIYLDAKNHLLADELQAKGTLSQVTIYPQEIVKRAMALGASGVIVSHNHPSGDYTPSAADKAITRNLKDGLAFMDIVLIDHIIVSTMGYFSFKANGLLID